MAFWETVLGKYIMTMAIAAVPVVELRGAIPYGVVYDLPLWLTYIIAIAGNMLPVPFLILLARKVIEWMKKHHILDKLTTFVERKGKEKAKTVQAYSFWGLFILVAIPLPGTGAWTGALVASLLDMRLKRALPAIGMGVAVAGLIVLVLTYGVIHIGTLV